MSSLHWTVKGSTGRLYHAEYQPFSLWLTLGRQQPPEEMWLQVNRGTSKPIFHLKIQTSDENPFIVAENLFFAKYVSPMELLAKDLANPNPSLHWVKGDTIDGLLGRVAKSNPLRLPWRRSANLVWPSGTQRNAVYLAPYDATRELRVELTGYMTHGDSYVRLYTAVVQNTQDDRQEDLVLTSTTQDFENDEALLEYVENEFFDRFFSPMQLLGLGLTANENPRYLARRNPQLSWTKTDEVHLHGSDDISRLIVYETRYDRTRWLRLDLSEHTELETSYYLVDDAYVETPEGTIGLGREFKADFDTESEALDHFENYFFTHFTTPMEMLSRSLKANPRRKYTDVKGRSIPARYLKGLPKELQEKRIKELGKSRDAYKRGDYSELATDKAARKLGLVKQSAYSIVAERRGIEWRGDAEDMVRRVLKHYKVKASEDVIDHTVEGIQRVYNKGLAAWKSGGHRPGATAKNWAVARVASLVVGGKAAFTADKKEFSWFPAALRKKIVARQKEVISELRRQNREDDIKFLENV